MIWHHGLSLKCGPPASWTIAIITLAVQPRPHATQCRLDTLVLSHFANVFTFIFRRYIFKSRVIDIQYFVEPIYLDTFEQEYMVMVDSFG